MVNGRLLGDLILREGATVSAYGWFDDSEDQKAVFWSSDAWQPQLFRRLVGADVHVLLADPVPVPAGAGVEVVGTWRNGSIVDAAVAKPENLVTYRHESPHGVVHPIDLGRDKTVGLLGRLSKSGSAPTIASGGMDGGIWLHKLYMTAEFVRIHSSATLRTDVFVSIVPIEARDPHRAL